MKKMISLRVDPGTDELLRAEDLFDLPETEDRDELVRGEVVREPLPGFGHGSVAVQIAWLLKTWVLDRDLGRVVDHCGFVLARDPDTVRGPDVAFVRWERVAEGRTGGPFFDGAPDLAVEVLSPSNGAAEIASKVGDYLGAGARSVWIVDPERREVTVHRPGRGPRLLREGDLLDGGTVLPGFAVDVALLFE